jgi:hypothetical protein
MEETNKQNERRTKFRFTIERDLRYKMAEGGVVVAAGAGQTVNVSSGGVAFVTEHALNAGSFIELSISWPVLLGETCPMRLIVFGRVLRGTGQSIVCSIDKYEFRTQARNLQATPATRSDGMLQRWADGMRKEIMKTTGARA